MRSAQVHPETFVSSEVWETVVAITYPDWGRLKVRIQGSRTRRRDVAITYPDWGRLKMKVAIIYPDEGRLKEEFLNYL